MDMMIVVMDPMKSIVVRC